MSNFNGIYEMDDMNDYDNIQDEYEPDNQIDDDNQEDQDETILLMIMIPSK